MLQMSPDWIKQIRNGDNNFHGISSLLQTDVKYSFKIDALVTRQIAAILEVLQLK